MGLFDFLFGGGGKRTNVEVVPDHIWMTTEAKFAGLAQEAEERSKSDTVAAPLERLLAAGGFDEDASHGRGGEEVSAAAELLIPDESQVRFVDEGGGVERVARPFLRHPRRGELAQLAVDERQQVARGAAVAGRGSNQDLGHISHATNHNAHVDLMQ